jgi:hypothetical protein
MLDSKKYPYICNSIIKTNMSQKNIISQQEKLFLNIMNTESGRLYITVKSEKPTKKIKK